MSTTGRDIMSFLTRYGADELRVFPSTNGERGVIQLHRSKPVDLPAPSRSVTRGMHEVFDFTPADDTDGPRIEVIVPRGRG